MLKKIASIFLFNKHKRSTSWHGNIYDGIPPYIQISVIKQQSLSRFLVMNDAPVLIYETVSYKSAMWFYEIMAEKRDVIQCYSLYLFRLLVFSYIFIKQNYQQHFKKFVVLHCGFPERPMYLQYCHWSNTNSRLLFNLICKSLMQFIEPEEKRSIVYYTLLYVNWTTTRLLYFFFSISA